MDRQPGQQQDGPAAYGSGSDPRPVRRAPIARHHTWRNPGAPGGQPIVQMCDANTMGGYPKIAVVVEADLWRLAQVRLGGRVRFVEVTRSHAVAASAARDGLPRAGRAVRSPAACPPSMTEVAMFEPAQIEILARSLARWGLDGLSVERETCACA